MADQPTINVRIIKIGEVLFNGPARALSSIDPEGPFDILPFHTNFIAIIKKRVIVHTMDGKKKIFNVDSGILRNTKNQVEVFLGINVNAADVQDIGEKEDFFSRLIEEEQLKQTSGQ